MIKPHEPIRCPVCNEPLKVHTYNKVVQKRHEGKDWAEMWCDKCEKGYDRERPKDKGEERTLKNEHFKTPKKKV